jgi:hypothetical protein
MKQISVDFNSLNSEPLDLVKLGPTNRLPVSLEDGDLVWIYDEGMIVLARVRRQGDFWMAEPDWSSVRQTPPDLAATNQ